jgi:predicted ester cyclase
MTERNGSDDVDDGARWWEDSDLHPNAALVARSMHELLNEREITAIEEYHHDTLAYFRSSDTPGDREALRDDILMFLDAFPDLEATIEEVFVDADDPSLVTLRYTVAGTHAGTFESIPPTDEHIDAQGIAMAEFDGEMIAHFSLVFDNLGMLQDLGLVR